MYLYIQRGIRRSATLVGERLVGFLELAGFGRLSWNAVFISVISASPLLFVGILLKGGAVVSLLISCHPLFGSNAFLRPAFLVALLSAVLILFPSYWVPKFLDLWVSMATDYGPCRLARPMVQVCNKTLQPTRLRG